MTFIEQHFRLLPRHVPAGGEETQWAEGMSLAEAFRVAIQGLVANKLRSFLTMLGIIIGVAAVIVMVALGQGVANATQTSIAELGTNVLTVMPNSAAFGGVSQGLGSVQTLKMDDIDAIRRECPSVLAVTPEYHGSAQVQFGDQNTRTTVLGAAPSYFDIRNLPLADGRLFTDAEVGGRERVAVLGDTVRQTLFEDTDAVGKTIRLNGEEFAVIGVTQPRGGNAFRNQDDQVTIPITTAMYRVFGVDTLNSIDVQAVSQDRMNAAQSELLGCLELAHRTRSGDPPDVRIFNQQDLVESAQQQSRFLTMLLAGIPLVSLIVGGIGIMNIMLVSVTERTREIGIRKAIGAERKDILLQFLIESITLSVAGGLIGVILGAGSSLWASLPKGAGGIGFPMALSLPPILISFGFSALVSVFFGIYPAMKASALDPIAALRHE